MALISDFISQFFQHPSRFHIGDHVQTCKDGPLMIVQWIKSDKKAKRVILKCKWFDTESRSNRSNLFVEEELIPFDWHRQTV